MRQAIIQELEQIEKEYEVKILYAIESGSRGWGFESKDSDYDVRFIYVHKPEWYLSIKDKRDVIELPIDDLLDINGWDLRKALVLFRKSNPTLLEWFNSPIMYKEYTSLSQDLDSLLQEYFSSKSCIYHYLHMAEGNYREYLRNEEVKLKKYFYVLRPIMACMWIEKYGTKPPMLFEELMNALSLDTALIKEIEVLLVKKRKGLETNTQKRIDIVNEFLEQKIAHFKEYVKTINADNKSSIEPLDDLFRKILEEAWTEQS